MFFAAAMASTASESGDRSKGLRMNMTSPASVGRLLIREPWLLPTVAGKVDLEMRRLIADNLVDLAADAIDEGQSALVVGQG